MLDVHGESLPTGGRELLIPRNLGAFVGREIERQEVLACLRNVPFCDSADGVFCLAVRRLSDRLTTRLRINVSLLGHRDSL